MQEYTKEDITAIWKETIKDAQGIIAREPLLEDLVDDVVIKSETIFEAISKRLARKLGQNALYENHLIKLFYKVFNRDDAICQAVIANIVKIAKEDSLYNSYAKVILYSRKFQISTSNIIIDYLLANGKEDIALYAKSLYPSD